MDSFASIISTLGGPTVVARELGAEIGTVQKMKDRDSINYRYWLAFISLARRKKVPGITRKKLEALAASKIAA